jgi:type VI secretion system secreted protein VgrG
MSLRGHALYFESGVEGAGGTELRLHEIAGESALSTPYELRLKLDCVVAGGLEPDAIRELLRKPCRVHFGPYGAVGTSGVLSRFALAHVTSDGYCSYEATLRPRLWAASLGKRSRIFNELALPDIVRAVLGDTYRWREGRDFELVLEGDYAVREYVVQYEESDLAFLSRWLEHYGIYYYFEETDEGEKVVFADANRASLALPDHESLGYAFYESELEEGAVHDVRIESYARAARVHVRDFNWRTPATVTGDATIDAETGWGTYGEVGDHFKDGSEASMIARVRAEEHLARSERYLGASVTPSLAPGCRFDLAGAPIASLERTFLVTRVVHHATQRDGGVTYRNEWEAIDYEVEYRPPRVTPRPRIDGVVHAIVDGKGGTTAAPIDSLGRYRVRFPFDMKPGEVGRATRWIRMAQSSTGGGYGMHFPLHTGTEVIVAHTFGDPDRPVIVGAVPNAATEHFIQETRATRSAIRSRSGVIIDIEDDA